MARLVYKRCVPFAVGPTRPYGSGKRGLKAGFYTMKQWKARNRYKHNGGTGSPDKTVVYWPLGKWAGGNVK